MSFETLGSLVCSLLYAWLWIRSKGTVGVHSFKASMLIARRSENCLPYRKLPWYFLPYCDKWKLSWTRKNV